MQNAQKLKDENARLREENRQLKLALRLLATHVGELPPMHIVDLTHIQKMLKASR